MHNLFNALSLRSIAVASALALAGLSAVPVSAGYQTGYQPNYGPNSGPAYAPGQPEHYPQRPAYYYKEFTVYETRQVPDVQWITKYDHCGKPYQVKVLGARTIRVPVTQRIKVAY